MCESAFWPLSLPYASTEEPNWFENTVGVREMIKKERKRWWPAAKTD